MKNTNKVFRSNRAMAVKSIRMDRAHWLSTGNYLWSEKNSRAWRYIDKLHSLTGPSIIDILTRFMRFPAHRNVAPPPNQSENTSNRWWASS